MHPVSVVICPLKGAKKDCCFARDLNLLSGEKNKASFIQGTVHLWPHSLSTHRVLGAILVCKAYFGGVIFLSCGSLECCNLMFFLKLLFSGIL